MGAGTHVYLVFNQALLGEGVFFRIAVVWTVATRRDDRYGLQLAGFAGSGRSVFFVHSKRERRKLARAGGAHLADGASCLAASVEQHDRAAYRGTNRNVQ